MKLRAILGAAIIAGGSATLAGSPAEAVTIDGQLDITGIVNVRTSSFELGGTLDFDQDSGENLVVIATGDFSSIPLNTEPTLFDLNFSEPEDVYTVGGFTFTATDYFDFDNAFPGRGFSATGVLSAAGFDNTPGLLTLSTQSNSGRQIKASFSSSTTTDAPIPVPPSLLMLLSALGGIGLLARRTTA